MESILLLLSLLLLLVHSSAQMPGFVSLDCGGEEFFTDDLGLNWSPDGLRYGGTSFIEVLNETRKQYTSLRHFPADSRKYCYTMNVTSRTRFPDDPFDRIWLSDTIKEANYLVDIAAGTKKVATELPIDVTRDDLPPQKVMQTAVVGTNGSLTYRLNLDGFPGTGWAVTYFAEIEDLAPDESRKFRLEVPGNSEVSKPIVNIEENAQGKYRLYEPGFTNISLPFILNFKFVKTSDSTRGPLLNAMEINKYLEKTDGSQDGTAIASFISPYSSADWAQEGGDPCLPVPWSWVECNAQPRIVKIRLSSMNLTGDIPSDLTKLSGLVELWLDGNSLTGPVPDFSGFLDLKIM